MLAFEGQGRDDMLPALDLAYVKLVGRWSTAGGARPRRRSASFFAPYGEYAALAGIYALQRRFP